MKTTLSQWLCLLWNIAPPLHLNSELPCLMAGAIHLPPQSDWRHHRAAAAHAAAHLVYSPRGFEGHGLGPIARALAGLLEDARVEALALRELPGLARLWRPLHTATPESGHDFEALMRRLARALFDPVYEDPDHWVRKGRALFVGDPSAGIPPLSDAAQIRGVAMRLGHDIGQLRLQFNAKTYRVAPDYRDDHRWMWAADVLSAVPPPAAAAGSMQQEPVQDFAPTTWRYPEWDRLIERLRPDWCSVIEHAAIADDTRGPENEVLIRHAAARLRRPLRALTHQRGLPRRSAEGEVFDPGALVERQVARHRHAAPEQRVYRVLEGRRAQAAVSVLIDQSASTADVQVGEGLSVLQTTAFSAAAMAQALAAAGVDCSIAGFSSNGRHAVDVRVVKSICEAADHAMLQRLQALRPGGSTRLGAALRHATHRLLQSAAGPRFVIVLSDGEPYDIDVHDRRYLVDDARHAVRAAAHAGVRVICLAVTAGRADEARHIFGRAGVQLLRAAADMPRALQRLLA